VTDPTRAWRAVREPAVLFGVALVGSAAAWGRLWVTAPRSRGLCGCGDPSLFQWFLAWPAHALSSGHSLVFSRDLFHPDGINLLSNTSVLALGVPLAPVTWLGGPVLTQNVALLLAIPVAVCAMDLLLRRVTDSLAARAVLSLLYGFSPYVVNSLSVSHLMTAWIGVLPLICLGVVDAVSDDRGRSRRGQVLLAAALVVQFFLSTELLALSAIVALLVLALLGATALVTRRVDPSARAIAVRLAWPLGATALLLAAPAGYALYGPQSLKGNIWGRGFNPDTGGTSFLDLVRPHVTTSGFQAVSGYNAPVVQLQYLGWGVLVATVLVAVWRWRDGIVRVAALVAAGCVVLSLSPLYVSWAPWQWIGTLPVLENVLQFRIAVFALLAAIVVVARGVGPLVRSGRAGVACGAVLLAGVAVPVAIPVAQSLPLRTVDVRVPPWWRAVHGTGVVLAYPFPGQVTQSALTWQADAAFAVPMLGGSGPQSAPWRWGADGPAFAVLTALSNPLTPLPPPTASVATAAPVRGLLARDHVTEVVVPVTLRGRPLAVGRPSEGAAVFFTQVLGTAPAVMRDAWVFTVDGPLPAPRFVPAARAARCAARAASDPTTLGRCLLGTAP
jgi:hypothetical protein